MSVEVRRSSDAEALARAVADGLVALLASAQAEGRVPEVALTGGTIAEAVYREVASIGDSAVDWSRVDLWWGDERFVPAGSEDRNDAAVRKVLLDVIGTDPARVHPMPAADEAHHDAAAAASSYGREVRGSGGGRFDLVLLGMGPDGHVASLFPGFPQLSVDDEIAVAVADSPKPPPERITLTFPALNRTREVWFLVSGEGKAEAVARALAADGSVAETPARGISCERTVWWLDESAASALAEASG